METKQLGRTNLTISAIGLGAMPMSLSTRPPEAQAIQTIHRALDLGVSFIDTADSYCRDEADKHHSETLICKALQQYSGDTQPVVVATKGGLLRPQGQWVRDGNPDRLRQAIRRSFEALGGEHPIALWQYHAPDPNYSLMDSLTPVKEAVENGLVRFVGVSNVSVEQIQRAREIVNIVSVQNEYNPLQRQPEFDGVLAYCEQEGLTFMPYRPLGGRRRVGEFGQIPVLRALAQEKGVSAYCIILAWLRAKSPCIVPIPGATKPGSIEDSARAVTVRLSSEDVARIDREVAMSKQSGQSSSKGGLGLGWLRKFFNG